MFKLFDRNKAPLKPLQSPFDEDQVITQGVTNAFEIMAKLVSKLKADNKLLTERCESQAGEIIALKGIVANLRKQKVYAGQRFYNPKNHKAPVVYLCARWNEWYMIRRQNQTTPLLITAEHWTENFGHYELMPRTNTNLRNLG